MRITLSAVKKTSEGSDISENQIRSIEDAEKYRNSGSK